MNTGDGVTLVTQNGFYEQNIKEIMDLITTQFKDLTMNPQNRPVPLTDLRMWYDNSIKGMQADSTHLIVPKQNPQPIHYFDTNSLIEKLFLLCRYQHHERTSLIDEINWLQNENYAINEKIAATSIGFSLPEDYFDNDKYLSE